MKRIIVFRHPNCERCARFARAHHFFDWLNRVEASTATPPTGPLRIGEVVVQEIATGRVYRGAEGLALVFRSIPAYWPLRPLFWFPAMRARIDQELSGCADGSCQIGGAALP